MSGKKGCLVARVAFGAFAALALWQGTVEAAGAARDPFNGRQSYSGSNMNCLAGNDFYAVHFTAIQPGRRSGDRTDFAKYCREVPTVGKTYLSIDLLDRDVRSVPIALQVVEEAGPDDGQRPQVIQTLSQTAAKIYRTGTADIEVEISRPGHYALIATFGEDALSEDDHLRIPFSVGLPAAPKAGEMTGKIVGGLVLTFFGVMTIIGLRAFASRRLETVTDGDREISTWTGARQEKRT